MREKTIRGSAFGFAALVCCIAALLAVAFLPCRAYASEVDETSLTASVVEAGEDASEHAVVAGDGLNPEAAEGQGLAASDSSGGSEGLGSNEESEDQNSSAASDETGSNSAGDEAAASESTNPENAASNEVATSEGSDASASPSASSSDSSTTSESASASKTTSTPAATQTVVTGGICPDPTSLSGVSARRTAVGEGNATQGNLVILVRFAGDTTGDYDEDAGAYTGYNAPPAYSKEGSTIRTAWENLMSRYNCVEDSYLGLSVRDYLYLLSSGKHDLISVFPQTTADGLVEYITLSGTVDDYLSNGNSLDNTLINEAVAAFNSTYAGMLDASLVDTNADGLLDNLTILCQVDDYTFTSHCTGDSKGVSISTKQGSLAVANFNLIDTAHFTQESPEVAVHEYIHTLGIRDLYVKEGETATLKPVGVWDLMSSLYGSPWLLADTREKLGWTTIEEVSQAGTYTLYAPDSTGTQAIKVKSPLNDSEYFVIEYRQVAANKYSNTALDKRISGSGIIVYRVNPLYDTEGNGNVLFDSSGQAGYNVYVFRPGDDETKLSGGSGYANDTVGYATNAQISLAGAWSSLGSTDLSATFADGALTFSDGRNSGITIQATVDGDGYETFVLGFADYSTVDGWSEVGQAPDAFSAATTPGVAMTDDGSNLYVSVRGDNTSTVWKYDGSAWTQLEGSVPWSEYLADSAPVLYLDGSLYSLSCADSSVYSLVKYNAASGWSTVGADTISDCIGSAVSLVNYGGKLAVAYVRDSWKTGVRVLSGTAWKTAQQYDTFYQSVSSALDGGGNTYLLLDQSLGAMHLCEYDSSGNALVDQDISSLPSNCLASAISYSNGMLYVAVVDGGTVKVYSSKAADLSFFQLGDVVYSSSSQSFNGVGIGVLGGAVVCAYASDASGKVAVRSHALEESTTVTDLVLDKASQLADYDLNVLGVQNLTIISGDIPASACAGCTGLKSVTLGDGVTSVGASAFKGCTALASLALGSGVTSIGYRAFDGCTSLKTVDTGSGCSSIGKYAFNGCTSLYTLSLGESVSAVSKYAFAGCSTLRKVTLADGSQAPLIVAANTPMRYLTVHSGDIPASAFKGCTKLRTVTLGSDVSIVGYRAFDGCTALTTVDTGSGCSSIGKYAFSGCTALYTVKLGESVSSVSKYAFSGCITLRAATLANASQASLLTATSAPVRYLTILSGKVAASAFSGNTKLRTVTLGSKVASVGARAFYGCTALQRADLGGVRTIGKYAFMNCAALKSVTMPYVTSIGRNAFYGCTLLS